jgi:hypothetical protein
VYKDGLTKAEYKEWIDKLLYCGEIVTQGKWLCEFINDYGYTTDDYRFKVAYKIAEELGCEGFDTIALADVIVADEKDLSFAELTEEYDIPLITDDEYEWLKSQGMKITDCKEWMTQECFNHLKRLIEKGLIVFRKDEVLYVKFYDEIEDEQEF